jgi:hypothetical protein
MARKLWVAAFALIAAVAGSTAASTDPMMPTPAGGPDVQYCLRIEAVTGTRLETVRCWTRAEWTDQGVDVDKEWAREGVRVIEPQRATL